jgi:hypothetical protein
MDGYITSSLDAVHNMIIYMSSSVSVRMFISATIRSGFDRFGVVIYVKYVTLNL